MLASKPNPSGESQGATANHKQPSNRRATSAPRVISRHAIAKPADRAPSPLHQHHHALALDRSSASIDLQTKPSPGGAAERRRSFKASPATRAVARTSSELQAQLSLVQEDLRNAREQLVITIENDRAQILDDLAAARRLAADAEEALELERFKSTEREQSAVDEWRRKHDDSVRKLESEASALRAELRMAKESLAPLTNSSEEKQAQLLRFQDKVAALEKEASEYEERFLDTSRLLDVAAQEASELHSAIDGLRSEHQLLRSKHQQAIEELKAAMENAEERHRLRIDQSSYEAACLRKTVERMGSEAKRSDDGITSIQMEMNRLTESLRAAENEVQELRADKTQLLSMLQEFEAQATNTEQKYLQKTTEEEEAKQAECSHLKDLLSFKDKELLALNHELTELRLREMTARKAEEESTDSKSTALHLQAAKLEMDSVVESLKAEAKAAKEEKVQLQNKLRLLESKITDANLNSEEAKISSLRLKETLEDKEQEMASIAQENREMRAREAAAHAKIDELALLLAEASTARKGGGEVSVTRSPEKQHSVLLKLICSPMHRHHVQDDETNGNGDEMIQNQKEDIKHVEVETVRQVKCEKEKGESPSAVDANSLEKSKIIEDDLSKERDDDDSESSDDVESTPGDDPLVDQMNGLLIHGPTSSFNRDHQHVQKKKRALLRKFGSLLKKKTHFTKLSSHSHS